MVESQRWFGTLSVDFDRFKKIQSVYIDPIVGKIININEEVKTVVSRVHSSMTNLVRRARAWTVKEILKKLDITFGVAFQNHFNHKQVKA